MPKWKLLDEKQAGGFLKYKLKFEYTGKSYSIWYNLSQDPPEGFVLNPNGKSFCFLLSYLPFILYLLLNITENLDGLLHSNVFFQTSLFLIPFLIAFFFSWIWAMMFWKVDVFLQAENKFNRCVKVWIASLILPYGLVVSSGNIIIIGALIGFAVLSFFVYWMFQEEDIRYLNNLKDLLTGC